MTYKIEGIDLSDFAKVKPIFIQDLTTLNTPLGEIVYLTQELKSGLFIVQSNYSIHQNTAILGKGDCDLLEIQVNLSCESIYFKDHVGVFRATPPMSCNLSYLSANDNIATIYFKERTSYNTFDVHIPLALLENYFGESKILDTFLSSIYLSNSSALSPDSIPISVEIYAVVQQMKNCTFEGLTRKVFLESKVLELVALLHEKVTANENLPSKLDTDKMYEVASLIKNNLEQPFTIVELAQKVGLNQTKLKIAFKQVFGNTVFGYLQELRMNEAKRYLRDTSLSVQEISLLVGYGSISNFSAAFKNVTGFSPIDFRRM